jgi:hypothetical protein
MAFDPDKYLQEKTGGDTAAFDPDRYLAEKAGIKQPGTAEALFPRFHKAFAANRGIGSQAGAYALDLASGVLRVPAAGAAALASKIGLTSDEPKFGRVPEGTTFTGALNNLNQGKDEYGRPNIIDQIGQDPATVPATLVGSMIPIAGANPLMRILSAAAGGGAQGLTSGAVHQADKATQGNGFSLKDAAKEAGTGAAIGGALGVAGEGARSLGKKIVKAAIKPGHTGNAEGFDVENIFKNKLGGSREQMTAKTAAALEGLKTEQNKAISIASASGKKIPAAQLFTDVFNDMQKDVKAGKFFGDSKVIENQLQSYADDLRQIADPLTGEVPVDMANTLKQKLQSDATALYQAARAGKDVKANSAQFVSANLARKLKEAIEKAAPDVAKPNAKMKEIIPIAKALGRRNIIAGQNNPISLDELAALDAGAQFMTNGSMEGGLLPFLVRSLKSPYVGNKLYQGGGLMQSTSPRTLAELISSLQAPPGQGRQ